MANSFREKAIKRFSVLDRTCGSIVSTATWVALNAHHAADIMHAAGMMLSDRTVSYAVKEALLGVLHECVISCKTAAVEKFGRQAILDSIRQVLPVSLKAAASVHQEADAKSFYSVLLSVISAWKGMELFPISWHDECLAAFSKYSESIPSSATQVSSSECHQTAGSSTTATTLDGGHVETAPFPSTPVSSVLRHYQSRREKLIEKRARDESTEEAEADLANAAKSVIATLKVITEAVSSHGDISNLLGNSDDAERYGSAVSSMEANGAAILPPEDDVLGSFF